MDPLIPCLSRSGGRGERYFQIAAHLSQQAVSSETQRTTHSRHNDSLKGQTTADADTL